MAQPNFFVEGHSPRRSDTQWKIEQKILGALNDGGGGGSGLSGAGSPEGVVTANPGTTYLDTSTSSFWAKGSGTGDTGWVQLIA